MDESIQAKEISDYLGLDHHIIDSNQDINMNDMTGSIFNIYNELNDNLTALSINQISRASKNKVTVALGGIGGDELFFGYNKYNFLFKNKNFYKLNKKYYSLILGFLSNLNISSKINNVNDYINCDENLRFIALKDLNFKKLLLKFKIQTPNFNFSKFEGNFFNKIRTFDIYNIA